MPKRDDRLLIQDMLDACSDIRSFLGGCTQNQFQADRQKQYAVIKALEILGEAGGKLTSSFREKRHKIPWKQIIGMRNILIHVYHDVDLDLIWRTATVFVPQLEVDLTSSLH